MSTLRAEAHNQVVKPDTKPDLSSDPDALEQLSPRNTAISELANDNQGKPTSNYGALSPVKSYVFSSFGAGFDPVVTDVRFTFELRHHTAPATAAATELARLQFVIVTPFEPRFSRIYFWLYPATIENHTPNKIQIIGRRVEKILGTDNEPFWGSEQGFFASSFWGEHPLIEPGKSYVRAAALATAEPEPSHIELEFKAQNCVTGAVISVPGIGPRFERTASPPDEVIVGGELGRLTDVDAAVLLEAVNTYNAALTDQGWALFRADTLGLSPPGRTIVDCFLVADGQRDDRKARLFDFAPILPQGFFAIIFTTDDHYPLVSFASDGKFDFTEILSYNCPVLPPKTLDKGAAEKILKRVLARSLPVLGKDRVLEIAASAPPGDSAQVDKSMDVSALAKAAGREIADVRPTMSEQNMAAFRACSDENQWTEACGRPSTFIRKHFSPWFGLGLTRPIIKEAQPLLGEKYGEEIQKYTHRRIKEIQQAHELPAGAPPPKWARRVADLSTEERERRKMKERTKKANYRARLSDSLVAR